MRGSSATFRWSWLVGRGQEEAGPRRGAAGGGSGPVRRRSGDDGVGDLGRGGSVDVWEGDGEARSGNEGRKRPVRGELELAGGNGGFRARGEGSAPFIGALGFVEKKTTSGGGRFGRAGGGGRRRRAATPAVVLAHGGGAWRRAKWPVACGM